MRCPKCKHNQKKKDGDVCANCGYRFVLMPKQDAIHDYKLMQLVKRLSENGQYAFTRQQLLAEMLKSMQSWMEGSQGQLIGCSFIVLMLIGLTVFLVLATPILGMGVFTGILSVIFGSLLLRVWYRRLSNSVKSDDYRKAKQLLDKYLAQHEISGLVDGKAFLNSISNYPDMLTGMSPQAVLIVERNDIVDALIKSRFHIQHKTVVVSKHGYPQQVFAALPSFLRAHPHLPFYAVHDFSKTGSHLYENLKREPLWAFAARNLHDAGLNLDSFDAYPDRLPWIDRSGFMVLSNQHEKLFNAGARLPLDSFKPAALSALSAGVIAGGGVIALGLLASSSVEAGIAVDFG